MDMMTAKEFINKNIFEEDRVQPLSDINEAMVEFAKYCVSIAIDEVKRNTDWGIYQNDDGQEPFHHESNIFVNFERVDEDEILDAIK